MKKASASNFEQEKNKGQFYGDPEYFGNVKYYRDIFGSVKHIETNKGVFTIKELKNVKANFV